MRTQFLPKILGYAFIEAENKPNQVILTLVNWSKSRKPEIIEELSTEVLKIIKGSDKWEIFHTNGSRIIILPNKQNSNILCGYRANIMIIEGREDDYDPILISEYRARTDCVKNPTFLTKISELCGDAMYSLSTESKVYFTNE